MKYTITLFNQWRRPYSYNADAANDPENIVENTDVQKYSTHSDKMAIKIIRDFLDVPESKLSREDVEKTFLKPGRDLQLNCDAIMTYYNGRLDMFEELSNEIAEFLARKSMIPHVILKKIPRELNTFDVYKDEHLPAETQLDAYLEVTIVP